MNPIRTFWKQLRWASLLLPAGAGVLLGGCMWMMDPTAEYQLTYQGRVARSDNGAAVSGARVEIWLDLPHELGNSDPFVQGRTNAAGEFALVETLRSRAVPPDVTIRITPPAGSGLQAGSISGFSREVFARIEISNRKHIYTADLVLHPAVGT
jgi:hypothetical protein